ncbi:cyclophilin-like fold protein [uncultured Odoribacter sp.]|uniref:cyclophilin-like fold protein n=1 Tax=uncultured Odoribacter sp. TaxID=876416 RepID=UPI00261FE8AD|nr:cyclophilin-like fold protein [uncultured Odoribacter sp.]
MRKFLFIPLLLVTLMSMASCGGSDNDPLTPETPGEGDDNPDTPTPGGNGRYLVLYCSRTSNTERVAQQIQTTLDCDILEVEPQTAFESDYNAMLSRAQTELAAIREGNYPAIKTSVESFGKYDLIFVGYPIWYGSMATPMQTFLHEHAAKLAGKRIALFATSGSSGISSSVSEAKGLCSGATFTETLLLTSSTLSQMASRVTTWLEQLGANREENNNNNTSMKMNITVGGRTITATMEDNAAGRDFLSRLPLEVTLNDYNNITEKIFYPSPALTTAGVTRGCTPVPGDITIYVPWGNVAIFCKNWSQTNDLIKIGHIDGDGISALNVAGDVAVKFEKQ